MTQIACEIGYSHGCAWIEGRDVKRVTERIAEYERNLPGGIFGLLVGVSDAYTPAERLYRSVFVDDPDETTREDAAEFWGDHAEDLDYLHSFAIGVWTESGKHEDAMQVAKRILAVGDVDLDAIYTNLNRGELTEEDLDSGITDDDRGATNIFLVANRLQAKLGSKYPDVDWLYVADALLTLHPVAA